MNGPFLINLRVTTFRGMCAGAEHWYGRMFVQPKTDSRGTSKGGYGAWKHPVGDIELKRVLNAEEAEDLREKDGDSDWPQAGDSTSRFDTRGQLREMALEAFKLFSPDDLLVTESGGQTLAIAGARMDEFNAVPEHQNWQWLQDNGFVQDKEWTHD
jgi:hypothetical protein